MNNTKRRIPSILGAPAFSGRVQAWRMFGVQFMRQHPLLAATQARRTASAVSAQSQSGRIALAVVMPMALLLTVIFSSAGAMVEMGDGELSDVSGQALLQMGKTEENGFTFYKAGLDANLELNMNIKKLQLGCTASDFGTGQYCDIDIDNLSISGGPDSQNPDVWSNGRPASSALLARPFFEFAIKNDGSKTLREVVGIRLSSEDSLGMLTLGDQQPGASDPGNTSGINSLSGYMKLGATSGVAETEPRPMSFANYNCASGDPCTGSYAGLNTAMAGRIFLNFLGLGVRDFRAETYLLFLESANANVSVPATPIFGKRLSEVPLTGTAVIDPISFSGEMAANVNNVIFGLDLELQKTVSGRMLGLTADVPITQSLKFIHKISVDGAPFSLSMQRQNVLWPGASVEAEQGWWMAFENEIDIGGISPEDRVPITNDVLLQALGPEDITWTGSGASATCDQGPSVNCSLHTARIGGNFGSQVYGLVCDGFDCLGGSQPVGDLSVPTNVNFPLSNLKLGGQSVVPNCYGTARFC